MTTEKTIAFAADHAGFELKNKLKTASEQDGWTAVDFGTNAPDSVDYPDFAKAAAAAIVDGRAWFGVFICGSGTGMAISSNKVPGIRAANCWSVEIARLAREHNDANVLCIPARFISEADALAMMQVFLKTKFAGGHHAVRVEKIEY